MKTYAALAALFLSAGAASAANLSYSDSVALQSTNFTETLSVTQFDGSLGTLNSVKVTLDGAVVGDAKAESLDADAATVTLNLAAEIAASNALTGELAVIFPVVASAENLTAFDGSIDFAGTSGVTIAQARGEDMDMNTFTDSAVLAAFTGLGTIAVDIMALGNSSATGAGNVIQQFLTAAEATLTVVYDYTAAPVAAIPLPAGAPLLLLGLGALGLARRRA